MKDVLLAVLVSLVFCTILIAMVGKPKCVEVQQIKIGNMLTAGCQ